MEKRGITPLIATVILLGFTIAIVVIVILFSSNYIKDLQEKQGTIATTRLACATDISILIQDAVLSGSDITITLENTKETIDAFYVVVRNNFNKQQTIEVKETLPASMIQDYTITYNPGIVGIPTELDIIPRIKIS